MLLTDFKLNEYFWTANNQWKCTDIGSRTIVAVKVMGDEESEDEVVFDVVCMEGCFTEETEGAAKKLNRKIYCFKCEKEIKILQLSDSMLDYAGTMSIDFGYGSRFDRFGMNSPRSKMLSRRTLTKTASESIEDRRKLLLTCDEMRAYICDDCFETHCDLIEGMDRVSIDDETKVI